MVAELDRASRTGATNELLEHRPTLEERSGPEILAVEEEEVEGEEDQPVRFAGDRRAHRMEVGDAVRVLDDHFAIDESGAAAETQRRRDDAAVLSLQWFTRRLAAWTARSAGAASSFSGSARGNDLVGLFQSEHQLILRQRLRPAAEAMAPHHP